MAVTDQYAFEFNPHAYAPSRDYDPLTSQYGVFRFYEHFYGRMGDFDSKEEFECACQLSMLAQQHRIQFWVRNLVRREGSSFFLQKADGRFYPDFLCQLPGTADQPGADPGRRVQGRGSLGGSRRRSPDRRPVGEPVRGALPLRDGQEQALGLDRGGAEISDFQQQYALWDEFQSVWPAARLTIWTNTGAPRRPVAFAACHASGTWGHGMRSDQRRARKKSRNSALHSVASTPPWTCTWWLRPLLLKALSRLPAAPTLGSVAP